jgi:hypothetical protein
LKCAIAICGDWPSVKGAGGNTSGAEARAALIDRFPQQCAGIDAVLGDIQRIATGLGILSKGRAAFDRPLEGLSALLQLGPVVTGWRQSLSQRLQRAFGDDEDIKCALAANILYWHDDPDALWWILFAVAQGGYIGCGGTFVQGGSQRLSNALFRAMKAGDLKNAQALNDRMYPLQQAFYAPPFLDMHNRMKEALVLLGRLDKAVVRPPLMKLSAAEIDRIKQALDQAGISREGALKRAA